MDHETIRVMKMVLPIVGIFFVISWIILRKIKQNDKTNSVLGTIGIFIIFSIIITPILVILTLAILPSGWFMAFSLAIGIFFCVLIIVPIYIGLCLMDFKIMKDVDKRIFFITTILFLIITTMYLVWRFLIV